MRSLAYKAVVLIVVVAPLLATGLAIRLLWARAVHWSDLALLLTMYALVAFGVTVGYHRMLTHRSFRPHPVVKGLLGFGEGWHNNHHAFPRSAFHGLHWWQVDVSGYLIWSLERVGLAHEVYRVPPALLARRSTRQRATGPLVPELMEESA